MMPHPRFSGLLFALSALLVVGCNGDKSPDFAPASDRPSTTDDTGISGDDTDDPTDDTNTGGDSGGGDSGGGPSGNLDNEGDIYGIGVGEDEVSLADLSGDSNQAQEFFYIGINNTETAGGYRLRYGPASTTTGGPPAPPAAAEARSPLSPFDQRQRVKLAQHRAASSAGVQPPPTAPPSLEPPSFEQGDIGSATQTFNVASEFSGDETTPVRARLWGLGDSVNIWVDVEVPIDWDYDCDGVIDQPAQYQAYGFNNCDLQTVADIVDNNIIVNIRALYGEESDINGDGKVAVVITPVLNTVPLSSEDEDDWPQVVSYADPVTDLNEFSEGSNPGSDEQEAIYVFAPDPYGFYNPYFPTTVAEFTSMGLAAEIARSYLKLVLYNTHVLSYEPPTDSGAEVSESAGLPEATWLIEVLGAMAADHCGFGAVYYDDAWRYLDAPYLNSLTAVDDDALFSASSRGAQYLFGRWLLDTFGTDLLAALSQTEEIGVDNVEAATGLDFEDLVRQWQIAMLVTDVNNSDGTALVTDSNFPLYSSSELLSAPTTAPTTPSAGVFYGANGHQRGFNVRGPNQWIEGGTTASPAENTSRRVVADGPDFHTYVPGFNFYGYTAAGYGAHVVRFTRLEYDATALEIQAGFGSDDPEEQEGLFGVVIRWTDATDIDNAIDDVYSPLDVNTTLLPALPTDGSEIYAFGDISNPVTTQVVDVDGDVTGESVEDTDRYLLDLTDRTANELVQVAIWLDRRFENTAGQVAPEDPWIALVPVGDLPLPTVDLYNTDACPTAENSWEYPNRLVDYVFSQVFLGSTLYEDGDFDDDGDFDPCGEHTGGLSCDEDWDQDGVADADEPIPTTFVQQVLVEQCQDNGGTLPGSIIDDSWVDSDSVDEDDLPSFSVVYNIGGRSGEDGEEALLVTTLYGGGQYTVVVGGGGDTGAYELTLKQLN